MNDAEFQKLLNAGPPVILQSNRYQNIGQLILFAGVSLLMAYIMVTHGTETPMLWCVCVLISIFGLAMVYPHYAYPLRLVINQDGFVIESSLSEQYLRLRGIKPNNQWKNVSEFEAVSGGKRGMPRVWYNDNAKNNVPRIGWSRLYLGGDFNLGNNYGLTIEQLAQLMNHWRERALSGNSN